MTTNDSQRWSRMQTLLREQAGTAERLRKLTPAMHDALVSSGVFNVMLPKSLGGEEQDLVSMVRAVRDIARGDGSAGWCAMISGVYGAFGGLLPRAGAEEVFARPATIVAGALAPVGQAQRVPGGYRVSGRWPLGSNSPFASWFVGGAIVFENGAPVMIDEHTPRIRLCFMPAREIEIHDTWHATGLCATGSHDYSCSDSFVPEARAFWFRDEPVEPGPLYALPVVAAFGTVISAVTLGIAEHALDLFAELAPNKTPMLSPLTLQAKSNVHDRIGVALAQLEAATAYLEQAAIGSHAQVASGRRLNWRERGRLWLAGTHAAHSALQTVQTAYELSGSSAVYEKNGFDRCLRDARTASQHVMTQLVNYEIAGKQRLGLPVQGSLWSLDQRPSDPA